MIIFSSIYLLECPIPPLLSSSQKPSHGDISVTERGIIDPLVSKRPKKSSYQKIKKIVTRSKVDKHMKIVGSVL